MQFVRLLGVTAASAALVGGTGCGTGAKQRAAETALDAMSPEQRASAFEATARVLDEHPEYVDEFYKVVRNHRPAMDRFVANTARDLREPALANMNAKHIVDNPPSLEQVLVSTTEAAVRDPEARVAMLRAMQRIAPQMAELMKENPKTLGVFTEAFLRAGLNDKPRLRELLTKLGIIDEK